MMKTKPATGITTNSISENFDHAFVLKGKTLQVRINERPVERPALKIFKTEKELQDLILKNGKILFGPDTVLIEGKNVRPEFLEGYDFPAFLVDIKNPEKPKLYFIEIAHSKKNFSQAFSRMTRVFALLKELDNRVKLADAACRFIHKRKILKRQHAGDADRIIGLLYETIKRNPDILIISDSPWNELSGFMETYTDTWGKMVNPLVIRKFSSKQEYLITTQPGFAQIQNSGAKGKNSKEKVSYTEDYHMENVSEDVKTVYEILKAESLSKDQSIQFNPQKYYISMKKGRNLAFFHLRRKNLYLVVMCPEKQVRKVIKHHIIKSLPASVQKFWNGESTGLVIEGTKYITELINLLKKLVAGS